MYSLLPMGVGFTTPMMYLSTEGLAKVANCYRNHSVFILAAIANQVRAWKEEAGQSFQVK
jgi:hypothetical protein